MIVSVSVTAPLSCPVLGLQGHPPDRPDLLREMLYRHLRTRPARLLIEVSRLVSLDDASLAVLVVAVNEARKQGTRVGLIDPTEGVCAQLDLTGAARDTEIIGGPGLRAA